MNTAEQVEAIRQQMLSEGAKKPDIIRQLALACIGWPYVFGAWGEECTPQNRKRRVRSDHPTIKSKCQVLTGRASDCHGCQWYPEDERVRMYDCRGLTDWLLRQVGLDLSGQGATSQYNTAANWSRRGKISEGLPDGVCCVFVNKNGKMEHTGMHIGGGVVVECSVNVRTASVTEKRWTHYAVPAGLYEGEIPMTTIKTTVQRGNRGQAVREMQDILNSLGYSCGEADGVFGTKTFNALVAFQTDKSLDPDGVCGPKTWAALRDAERTSSGADAPPSPLIASGDIPTGEGQVTYRVTIEGVSWAQYKEILKICPLAECYKE